jgi:uncharacterized RDD family membrane protein YckC
MPAIGQNPPTEESLGRKVSAPLPATNLESPIVQLGPRLASRGSRLAATLVDGMVALTAPAIVALVSWDWFSGEFQKMIAAPVTFEYYTTTYGIVMFLVGLPAIATQAYFLTKRGQSLGKMALDIRIVMNDTHENGGFVPNFLRRSILVWLIGMALEWGVGAGGLFQIVDILFIFGKHRRCVHDHLARTIVVEGNPVVKQPGMGAQPG